MQKIYVYENKLFKQSSIDLYVKHLLSLKIKNLSTKQDCLDWIVYSPYLFVDNLDLDAIAISYGLVKTHDNQFIYYTDYYEYNEQVNLPSTKSFEWYNLIQII